MASDDDTIRGTISASVPTADLFARDNPASRELSDEARRIAIQVVDYGCALFSIANSARGERRVRDLVTAALLRRAVITLEAVRSLVFAGLMEPALATARTLQDIELALKHVLRDETDQKAHALAASHFLQYQRHGQDMLSNTPTREGTLTDGDRLDEVKRVAKNYATWLESPVFDGVRAQLLKQRNWHGYERTEDAFAALDLDSDYFMTYDTASWFVHGSNIDHDMIDGDAKQAVFRAFVERDPDRTRNVLGLSLLKSLELYELIAEDKGVDVDAATGAKATVRIDGRGAERISSLNALRGLVMRDFDVGPESSPTARAT